MCDLFFILSNTNCHVFVSLVDTGPSPEVDRAGWLRALQIEFCRPDTYVVSSAIMGMYGNYFNFYFSLSSCLTTLTSFSSVSCTHVYECDCNAAWRYLQGLLILRWNTNTNRVFSSGYSHSWCFIFIYVFFSIKPMWWTCPYLDCLWKPGEEEKIYRQFVVQSRRYMCIHHWKP